MDGLHITRRSLLGAGAAAGATIWLPPWLREADAASRRKVPLARGGGFSIGVMSGDPEPTAVTLLSRLDGQERDRVRVRVEIARDEGFRRVVARRDVPVTRLRDHTVKVRVGGLRPDERYWFRFATRTTHSEVGRTQTAPARDSRRPVKIGYFACQDYASGHYGAYRRLIEEDCDVVVCGGDYIYERIFTDDGYGGVREDRTGPNGDGSADTIGDYRAKYHLYRSDPDLHELHRLIPFVAQWDDHEVADNYAGNEDAGGPDHNRWDRARMLAGWRAWHEYMPALRFGKGYRTYRSLRFGATAELFMLDERTYRDKQPCNDATLRPCGESADPRNYLGREQMGWLKDGLSGASGWRLIGNQLMIMPLDVTPGAPVLQDSWEGYQAERTELLTHVKDRGLEDVAFLTGDIHTFFAGEVRQHGRSGDPVAVELVGGSTTSPGTAQFVENRSGGAVPADAARNLSDQLVLTNPWLEYAETRTHGVAVVEAGEKELRATYWGTEDVTSREATHGVRPVGRFVVPRGEPTVNVVS